jgi:predicted PurR-regulated permease PerM
MNSKELTAFLKRKEQRQAVLETRLEELEQLDVTLFGSKFGRFFGTTYFYLKRFLTLATGLILILIGLIFIVNHNKLVESDTYNKDLIAKYKLEYKNSNGSPLTAVFAQTTDSIGTDDANAIVANIDLAISKAVDDKVNDYYRNLGILMIIAGIFMLYISRMVKQLRRRNSKISKAETLTQNVIASYTKTIADEAKELALFKELIENQKEHV